MIKYKIQHLLKMHFIIILDIDNNILDIDICFEIYCDSYSHLNCRE